MLHQFIVTHRDEIISRCRGKAAARMGGVLSKREGVGEGIPVFLEQVVEALRLGNRTHLSIGTSATRHGQRLREKGLSVAQVVHDYGDVCQAITEIAVEMNAKVAAAEFCTLNLCLDDAIAGAVTEYARGEQESGDAAASRQSERWAFFTHELRNLVNTALLSFEAVRTGTVGVSGSTGGILYRSLTGLRAIAAQGEAGIRLTQGIQRAERIDVSKFIGEMGANAALDATTRNLRFTLSPMEEGVEVAGDRQVLGAVLLNLLQNAFKFTRPSTGVVLRVVTSADRVCIEVEDACGGLPGANPDDLFRPFEQRGADRSGLGLGLAFSRWGAEANNGRIYARSLPDRGCVFTLDLPRLEQPVFVGA